MIDPYEPYSEWADHLKKCSECRRVFKNRSKENLRAVLKHIDCNKGYDLFLEAIELSEGPRTLDDDWQPTIFL
jgi:hypothetical protein